MSHPYLQNSLLKSLTSDQVQDLIDEFTLKSKGYSVQYVVDHFELSIYCFPFGLKVNDDRQKYPVELITDEQIAQHSLFHDKNILFHFFDEYIDELNRLVSLVSRLQSLGIEVFDNLEKFKTEISEIQDLPDKNDPHYFEKLESNYFSLIISVAIEAISQGIEKLNNILKQRKAIITTRDIDNSNLSTKVKEILKKSKASKITDELYYVMKKDFLNNPTDEEIRTNAKLRNLLINRYRDCKVIDRILSINNHLSENNQKCFFLFLSSTKNSLDFFKSFHVKNLFSNFSGIKINPHRTTAQLFLSFLCREKNKTISTLESIKRLIQIEEGTATDNINDQDQKLINVILKRIDRYRNEYKNLAILDQYNQYKDIIDKAKEKVNNDRIIEAFDDLIEIIERDKKKKEIKKLKQLALNEIKLERNFIRALISGIRYIEIGGNFKISKGNDYVKGIYHRLPIVFNITNPAYRTIIDQITQLYLKMEVEKLNSSYLISFIRRSVLLLFDSVKPSEEEEIVRCLVFFMLPSEAFDTNAVALQRLEEILSSEINESDPNNLKQEFLYLASWAARRCENYEKAKEFANQALRDNSKDARFYHSLALIDYCVFRFKKDKNGEIDLKTLERTIKNSQIALDLFSKIENPSKEIIKSTISLINNKIYVYCLLHEYKGNGNDYLTKASNLLESIKEKEKDFYLFPEFIHTEVFLIYLKIISFNYAPEIKNAYIHYALNQIKKAIDLSPFDQDYIDWRDKLLKMLPTNPTLPNE